MRITFDLAKRAGTLAGSGIDFANTAEVFGGVVLTLEDERFAYGAVRFQTYGFLRERIVMVVWTPRDDDRHVISMRHCHEREAKRVRDRLG